MESLGEYLKKERESKGISIEEIANISRVSIRFLRAIEKNDYKNLPSEVFIKGFLKAYARCLKLNPDDVISKYENIKEIEKETGAKEVATQKSNPESSLGQDSKLIIFVITVLTLTLIGGVVYRKLIIKPEVSHEDKIANLPKTEKSGQGEGPIIPDRNEIPAVPSPLNPEPMISEKERPAANEVNINNKETINRQDIPSDNKNVPNIEALKPLTLTINAADRVWLQVVIDDSETKDAILQSGEKLTLKAKEKFSLTTGNVKGTAIMLDGVKITLPPVKSNVIKNYLITRGND